MQVTQSYPRPSRAASDAQGSTFDFAAELSRPPVSIQALIKESLSYARVMLALHRVVKGDWRTPQQDHSAYQEWVMERYVEELPAHLQHISAEQAKMLQRREQLKIQQRALQAEIRPLQSEVDKARYAYYQWLYKHDREKWIVLDPVISVHPDAVIFEGFSLDESAYGRVSVPAQHLDVMNEVRYGTTNIDFSQALANEIYRVRSYRPAWLKVAFEQVELSTGISENVEKKIDLPPSWVRGFLQVQSASTLEGISLTLDAQSIAQVLATLERKRERESPRSIRFRLTPNQPIELVVDPWNIVITDSHIYREEQAQEVRLWGRRRLFVMQNLLPYTDTVQVKLLGTGMPSYWSIDLAGHRLDLGLSGWTDNDWAKKGNFDLLASTGSAKNVDMKKVEQVLMQELTTTPARTAELLQIERTAATAALQEMCKNGQAMYDHLTGAYRWRQLLPKEITLTESEEDERLRYAVELVKGGQVSIAAQQDAKEGLVEYKTEVRGKNVYQPVIQLDADGRIKYADCGCSFHRRNKMRQGPCAHIMAAVIWIGKQ